MAVLINSRGFFLLAPSAPPRDVAIRSVSSDSIEIVWAAPDAELRNGVIVTYEVMVYQEMSNSKVKKIMSSLMNANTTLWKVSNLSPRTDYIFHIKAGTMEGFGPAVIIHKRSDGRLTFHFLINIKNKNKIY